MGKREIKRKPAKKKLPVLQKVLIVLVAILFVAIIAAILLNLPKDPDQEPVIDNGTPSVSNPSESSGTESQTGEESTPVREIDRTPTHELELDSENPLTGVPMNEDRSKNRPLAIVLGNYSNAQPMNGVSDADIIYEVQVEGNITRLLAIYQDFFDVAKVGSIRSARHYTAEIANSYDAIFITAGASPQALAEVRNSRITHLNEVEGPGRDIFFRDRNRVSGQRMGDVNSVVTTNDRILEWLPKYEASLNIRLEYENSYKPGLRFIDDGTPARGGNATEVTARFIGNKTTTFKYDSAKHIYNVQQYFPDNRRNVDMVDGNDGSAPEFTNILILKTAVSEIRGDASGRLNVATTGEGEGYFVCGGKYIEINWSRTDKSSPYVYTHKDGSILDLGRGKTYICIIPRSLDATFS